MVQRNTRQREVILEELRSVKVHPTAKELHALVQRKLPRTSLATVYRNLDRLAEEGLVHTIETAGSEKRFDGDISNHLHIRCHSCGCLEDLPISTDQVLNPVKIKSLWKVTGKQIEYTGICPQCNKRQTA